MEQTLLFALLIIQASFHLQGIFASTNKMETEKWNTDSIFIDKFFEGHNKRKSCFILYSISTLLFFSLAFNIENLFVPGSIWLSMMITTLSSSLIAIQVFPNAIGVYINRYFAIALNVIIAVLYFYVYSSLQVTP